MTNGGPSRDQLGSKRHAVVTRVNVAGHAGAKAPADIRQICMEEGFRAVDLAEVPVARLNPTNLRRAVQGGARLLNERLRSKLDDCVLVQHPIVGRIETKLLPWVYERQFKICVIHDLDFARFGAAESGSEGEFLRSFDVLIVHNPTMMQLVADRFPDVTAVQLRIFDYLLQTGIAEPTYAPDPSLLYVFGNLHPMKAAYLYQLCNLPVRLKAYGPNCDVGGLPASVDFAGVLNMHKPSLGVVEGYGLVWDGESADALVGQWGEYLRLNSPHKLSFYAALGVPVIVPRGAAMAGFVIEHDIGLVVESIAEAGLLIAQPDTERWRRHSANVLRLRQKLASGHFTRAAVRQALAGFPPQVR